LIFVIVFAHNYLTRIETDSANIPINIPEYVNIIRRLTGGIIAQSTIPFFIFISGFLLFLKEKDFNVVLRKKVRTILMPYLLWNAISVLFYFTVQSITDRFYQSPGVYVRGFSLLDWIDVFCGRFTDRNPFPLLYPLWFLRDLFIVSVFFIPIKKCIDKFPVSSLIAMLIPWLSGLHFFIVSYEILLFFSLGYYVVKYNFAIENIDRIRFRDLLPFYVITICLELFLEEKLIIIHKVNVIIGCIVLLKLSYTFTTNRKMFERLAYLGSYSFFVYVSHEPLLGILKSTWVRVLPVNGFYMLIQYFSVVIIDVSIVLILGILLKKFLPKVYNVLTGSR
jgi:hypothetical protein